MFGEMNAVGSQADNEAATTTNNAPLNAFCEERIAVFDLTFLSMGLPIRLIGLGGLRDDSFRKMVVTHCARPGSMMTGAGFYLNRGGCASHKPVTGARPSDQTHQTIVSGPRGDRKTAPIQYTSSSRSGSRQVTASTTTHLAAGFDAAIPLRWTHDVHDLADLALS